MSEIAGLIADTAAKLFDGLTTEQRLAAQREALPHDLWSAVDEAGLPLALLAEEQGGVGLSTQDAFGLIHAAGFHAVPAPVIESVVARWLGGLAGLEMPDGPLSFASGDALTARRNGATLSLAGTLRRVPWGRDAAAVLVVFEEDGTPYCAALDPHQLQITKGTNVACEPRDDLAIDVALDGSAVRQSAVDAEGLRAIGAALRSIQMAGALDRILTMTVSYANERKQFGQPIGKFQAIRQYVAVIAEEVAAAGAAAQGAARSLGPPPDLFGIAVAKSRTGEAASKVAALTHQIHGAMGFTQEHSLHFFTRRLWAWRDEFGNESAWNAVIGRQIASAGSAGLWPFLTERPQ